MTSKNISNILSVRNAQGKLRKFKNIRPFLDEIIRILKEQDTLIIKTLDS